MQTSILSSLINNAALLVSLWALYGVLPHRQWTQKPSLEKVLTGLVVGLIGVAVMLNPLLFAPGVVFDTRSIVLSISGLFFGFVPTVVAVLITGFYRIYLGGAGVYMGLGVIFSSAAIGLAWRYNRHKRDQETGAWELYLFGIMVHIVMILLMFALPQEIRKNAFRNISLPVLMLYPLGTVLLGGLFSNQLKRNQLTSKLIESEIRYRQLFDSSPDALFVLDANGRILDFNQVTIKRYGYNREELLGMTVHDLAAPELRSQVSSYVKQTLETGAIFEWRQRCKDGTELQVEVSAMPAIMSGKRSILSSVRDITERKLEQESNVRLIERLTLATRAAEMGIWDWDILNNKLTWDDKMYALYGLKKEEFTGAYEAWVKGLHPEDREYSEQETQQALRGEKEYDTQFRVIWPDGTIRHLTAQADIFRDANGKPARMVGVNYDITEQVQMQAALRQSEEQFSSAFHVGPAAMTITRIADGKFIDVNQAFLDMFEYDRDEAIGHTSVELNMLTHEGRRKLIEQQLETGGLRNAELLAQSKSGRLINLEFSSQPITLSGEACHVTTLIDITERKIAEEKLERQNRHLKLLREIDTDILAATSVESTVSVVLMRVRELMDCQRVNLTLIDWNTNESVIFDVSAFKESSIPKGMRFPLDQYQDIIQVLSQNQPLVMNDLPALKDPRPAIQKLLKDGLQSLCSLPLFSGGKLIGMLTLHSQKPNFFEDEEIIDLGQEIANQVAIAVTQKEMVLALGESEERLRLSTELANVAVWEYDFLTNSMSRSKNHDTLYGLEWQTTWKFETFLNSTHPDDREYSNQIIQNSAAPGGPESYEFDFRVVYPDHSIHWLFVVGQIVERDAQGQGTLARGSLIDITERKQAEERLKISEDRFKKLFDNASIGIIICDLIRDNNGKIIDYIHLQANKAIFTHAGITEEDVIGKRCSEVIPPEETAQFIELLTKVLEIGSPYSFQQAFPSLGRTIENRPFIIEKDSFAVTFFDITERNRAEEELNRRMKELTIIYQVGNRLRNNLAPDILASQIIEILESILSYEFAAVLLVDKDSDRLLPFAFSDQGRGNEFIERDKEYIEEQEPRVGKGITGWVAQTGQSFLCGDVTQEPLYFAMRPGIRSELCVPLFVGNSVIGVLNTETSTPDAYNLADKNLLETVGAQIAAAIQNTYLMEELQRNATELEQRVQERTTQLEQSYREQAAAEERQHLARELHDTVSQTIFSASLIAESLPRVQKRNPDLLPTSLADLQRLTRGALAEMRTLLLELRPGAIQNVRLNELLRQLANGLMGRTQLDVQFVADGDHLLPVNVRLVFFRIAQEALNNIVKHAHAKTVIISRQDLPLEPIHKKRTLQYDLILTIRDDGRGFDMKNISPGHHGLEIMRERIKSISGNVEILSRPGKGTVITLTWRGEMTKEEP